MRQIFKKHKKEWYEMDDLDPRSEELQRIIMQMDFEAVKVERKWGVGVLEKYCSPDLKEKWQRQMDKLEEALSNNDVDRVRDLAMGIKRGWKALEKDVLAQGIEPIEGEFLALRVNDGKILVICRDEDDASKAQSLYAGNHNVDFWMLNAVAEKLGYIV